MKSRHCGFEGRWTDKEKAAIIAVVKAFTRRYYRSEGKKFCTSAITWAAPYWKLTKTKTRYQAEHTDHFRYAHSSRTAEGLARWIEEHHAWRWGALRQDV